MLCMCGHKQSCSGEYMNRKRGQTQGNESSLVNFEVMQMFDAFLFSSGIDQEKAKGVNICIKRQQS